MSRNSPSGPQNGESNFPGFNDASTSATEYQQLGTLNDPTTEIDTQYYVNVPSKLQSLEVQIIDVGAGAGANYVWNVRVNGVAVPGMTVSLDPLAIGGDSATPTDPTNLAVGDLLSLEVVTGAATTAPKVRTFLNVGSNG